MFPGARMVHAGLITWDSAVHLAAPRPWKGERGTLCWQDAGSWGSAREMGQAPGPGLRPYPSQAEDDCEARKKKKKRLKYVCKILKEKRGAQCSPDFGFESHLLE